MEASSGNFKKPVRKRNDKGRRSWSRREEEVLISALKEVIANGWKSENGFKIAIFKLWNKKYEGSSRDGLEGDSTYQLKDTCLEEGLRRLVTMLSQSGIGWNDSTNMIEAPMMHGQYVDSNARLMRNKSWPFFNDWVIIFGKDRATGEHAEDFIDAVNHVLNGSSIPQEETPDNLEHLSENFEDETETQSMCHAESNPQTSVSGKKRSGKKRKPIESLDPLCDVMKTFCRNTTLDWAI
ncbi:hypothetical protein DH2020_039089 [Rehmannia glutinosa]|uniref:Myb/SANT-like domain-containing protein n=1 Tax=Rehmannia glutinosa TaxID=99300 RepID=A0ABR0UWS5_REHGL